MNAILSFLLSLMAALTGADPCENTTYSDTHAEQCEPSVSPGLATKHIAPCSTDISNGF